MLAANTRIYVSAPFVLVGRSACTDLANCGGGGNKAKHARILALADE